MMHPYFPVPFDGLGADIEFHELSEGQEVTINKTVKVNSRNYIIHKFHTLTQ